ncbi:MAG TPA: NAD(P)/FAD-dependent oxidoreductase [Vicinamibacterales bacterium]|nr:NAD(P)/FAD-dependent oxidoreductase [Vicinamibacterales bacterium]
MFDVIVVGGGPAGLSAALMLGRCRRRVLLCDEGQPRNRHSRALHGYLTRDGMDPSELNALGRRELDHYGVECRSVHVNGARREGPVFRVDLRSGATELTRFLLIATGVVDDLPDLDGARECYGRSLFHCPYCDGWERRDQRLAAFGRGQSGVLLALSLKTWSSQVTLLTNGARVDPGGRARLARNGVEVVTTRIARLVHDQGALAAVELQSSAAIGLDAIFFTTAQHPRCNLAETLGCAFNRKGTVDTGALSDTNVPGVFVAGDASHDAQFVVVAAAEGVKAALAINQALQREDLHP